jgi:hypothetical protein
MARRGPGGRCMGRASEPPAGGHRRRVSGIRRVANGPRWTEVAGRRGGAACGKYTGRAAALDARGRRLPDAPCASDPRTERRPQARWRLPGPTRRRSRANGRHTQEETPGRWPRVSSIGCLVDGGQATPMPQLTVSLGTTSSGANAGGAGRIATCLAHADRRRHRPGATPHRDRLRQPDARQGPRERGTNGSEQHLDGERAEQAADAQADWLRPTEVRHQFDARNVRPSRFRWSHVAARALP